MANIGKIAGGLGLITAGLAVVVVGPRLMTSRPEPTVVRDTAVSAGKDASAALRARFELLEGTAREAATTEPLRAAIKNKVDGPTIVDLFATEDWWKPRRNAFPLSRVVIGGSVASHGDLPLGDLDRNIVAQARATRTASGFALVTGRPVEVVAARIDARDDVAPVLVLAQYFNQANLKALADQTQLGLVLATSDRAVLTALAPEQSGVPDKLLKRQDDVVLEPELGWVAAAHEVGPGMRLWAVRAIAQAAGAAGKKGVGLWMVGAVLGLLGAALLATALKRRSAAGNGAPTEVPRENTIPFGTTGRNQHTRLAGADAARGTGTAEPARAASRTDGPLAAPPPHKLTPLATQLPMPPVEKPRTFGRYRLLDLLGVGGMSEVYTAVAHGAEGFERTFVVKRLKPELARDREAVSQFIDEARIQSCLLHSNIVPVFDFGTMGDEFFMAQEYVIGRDLMRLSTRCIEKTNFCLDPRIVYYIAYETLQALAYAHGKKDKAGNEMGIVHRDVSASNIMVTAAGDVRLFDFGIAKTGTPRQAQTQAGLVKGNANFMSPEQARGQQVDGRSDLFSLGMVLYYCMTGCLFYTGDNDLDVLYRAACGPTEKDLVGLDQLPGPAGPILRRALAFKPEDRYQSAEEFAAALAPYAVGMKAEAARLMEQLFGSELNKEAAA